ncbi:fibroblast growth factor 21, partial [Conger conger]|uniref:fibroblast growth factor 21 n=1 Tax=Conger conger TaxID=82655 RepID=UPI002A59D8CA
LLLLLLLPVSDTFYLPDSNPLLSFNDQVRERHLYTANKRHGLFLEMGTDGTVRGTPEQTANSVLELRSVRTGETVIRGVSSSLYLCADTTGRLRGESLYKEVDCTFNELLQANGYTLFLSKHHGFPVSLASKLNNEQFPPFSQFLPLRTQISSGKKGRQNENQTPEQQNLDTDSEDPFGMGRKVTVHSPEFHSKE